MEMKQALSTSILESESFVAASVDGIVVVRWFADAAPEEFIALTTFIVAAAAAAGGNVHVVAIVPPLNCVPRAGLPEAATELAIATRDIVETAHVVLFGGSGFWQTIVRSIITSLVIVVRKHGQVAVHESVDAAIALACTARGLDVAAWRKVPDTHGLLDRDNEQSGRFRRIESGAPRKARN